MKRLAFTIGPEGKQSTFAQKFEQDEDTGAFLFRTDACMDRYKNVPRNDMNDERPDVEVYSRFLAKDNKPEEDYMHASEYEYRRMVKSCKIIKVR
jgi:hypothetical protein